jgi:hypothetical protein
LRVFIRGWAQRNRRIREHLDQDLAALGVAVGLGLAVAVGVAVWVAVGVGVAPGVGVTAGVAIGDGAGDGVGVGLGLTAGVADSAGAAVGVELGGRCLCLGGWSPLFSGGCSRGRPRGCSGGGCCPATSFVTRPMKPATRGIMKMEKIDLFIGLQRGKSKVSEIVKAKRRQRMTNRE